MTSKLIQWRSVRIAPSTVGWSKNYARADLVGPEIHVDLAKLVDNLLSKKQDDASLKQCVEQYRRPANCILRSALSEQGNLWQSLCGPTGHRWGPAGRTGRPPKGLIS